MCLLSHFLLSENQHLKTPQGAKLSFNHYDDFPVIATVAGSPDHCSNNISFHFMFLVHEI